VWDCGDAFNLHPWREKERARGAGDRRRGAASGWGRLEVRDDPDMWGPAASG
jgi:hypothetical protein